MHHRQICLIFFTFQINNQKIMRVGQYVSLIPTTFLFVLAAAAYSSVLNIYRFNK